MNKKVPMQFLQMRCIIVFFLVAVVTPNVAQTLKRQCIPSYGVNMVDVDNGIAVQQTVGQPYSTNTYYSEAISYLPGFLQPVFKMVVIHSNFNLTVFPNPAANLVTIESAEIIKEAVVQVTDISGRILIKRQISELQTFSFNAGEWANGSYIISVSDGQNNSYSGKLIILK